MRLFAALVSRPPAAADAGAVAPAAHPAADAGPGSRTRLLLDAVRIGLGGLGGLSDHVVDGQVEHLGRKLQAKGPRQAFIACVFGVGCRLDLPLA